METTTLDLLERVTEALRGVLDEDIEGHFDSSGVPYEDQPVRELIGDDHNQLLMQAEHHVHVARMRALNDAAE